MIATSLLPVFLFLGICTATPLTGKTPANCGATLVSGVDGTITSPNFPEHYDDNVNCNWIIQGLPGKRLKIEFESMNLERSHNCNADKIEITEKIGNDNDTVLMRVCGPNLPSTMELTPGASANIHFQTDAARTEKGFKINYKFV